MLIHLGTDIINTHNVIGVSFVPPKTTGKIGKEETTRATLYIKLINGDTWRYYENDAQEYWLIILDKWKD
jgi:hypothetical protein